MKVIRLDQQTFEQQCSELGMMAQSFQPEICIGIKSGGAIVLDSIRNSGVLGDNIFWDYIKIQRRSTSGFKSLRIIGMVISLLPKFLIYILRIGEMKFGEIKARIVKPGRNAHFDLQLEVMALVQSGARILIVDDAVDTGTTIEIAKDYFMEQSPHNIVKIASLTTTHKHPILEPDYCLHTRTILQFPWSLDAKQ